MNDSLRVDDAMNGHRINVAGDSPGGTDVTVPLPITGASDLPDHSLAPNPPPVARPRRILVVDDDADSAAVLNRLLTLWGHEVVTAGSGGEAVEQVRVHRPEVVLLDIGLPDADGFELIGPLRAANESPMTVMALTGHAWLDARLAVDAGFDGYFAKPIELDALQARLSSLPITPD